MEDEKPRCVCLNGQSTPENCDQNGRTLRIIYYSYHCLNSFEIEIGTWMEFSDWSSCSVTCGDGFQFRKRECLSASDKKKKISNDNCIGKDTEIKTCNVTSCPSKFIYNSFEVQ